MRDVTLYWMNVPSPSSWDSANTMGCWICDTIVRERAAKRQRLKLGDIRVCDSISSYKRLVGEYGPKRPIWGLARELGCVWEAAELAASPSQRQSLLSGATKNGRMVWWRGQHSGSSPENTWETTPTDGNIAKWPSSVRRRCAPGLVPETWKPTVEYYSYRAYDDLPLGQT